MLSSLFSNVTHERLLLFLFVNQRGYGSQISSSLEVPLTPIQYGLSRLEEGGVLRSHFNLNKRIYEFNLNFPLFSELQELLKKAYILLPPILKNKYCLFDKLNSLIKNDSDKSCMQAKELERFFSRLGKVKKLEVQAYIKQKNALLQKVGRADVEILKNNKDQITFLEKGYWETPDYNQLNFKNCFCWTHNKKENLIRIEHLLHGNNDPMFLFDLQVEKTNLLKATNIYYHKENVHLAKIKWNKKQIIFSWRIIGASKNDFFHYVYQ